MAILSQSEAARYVGVHRATIWRWDQAGRLPRIPTRRPGAYYDTADLDLFLPEKVRGAHPDMKQGRLDD